jgi:hypothetical protein
MMPMRSDTEGLCLGTYTLTPAGQGGSTELGSSCVVMLSLLPAAGTPGCDSRM